MSQPFDLQGIALIARVLQLCDDKTPVLAWIRHALMGDFAGNHLVECVEIVAIFVMLVAGLA